MIMVNLDVSLDLLDHSHGVLAEHCSLTTAGTYSYIQSNYNQEMLYS